MMNSEEMARARAELERHLRDSRVRSQEHFWQLVDLLSERVRQRRRIYLDANYWVHLRNAALGRPQQRVHGELLGALRSLVETGRVVCPVSDVAFVELTQQTDSETRIATARLWDELSLGCALQTEQARITMELQAFMAQPQSDQAWRALAPKMLVRPCYVLGAVVPSIPNVPAAAMQAIQKAVMDRLWAMSFEEMVSESSADLMRGAAFQATAEQINHEMRLPQNRAASFEKAFNAEIGGAVRAAGDSVKQAIATVFAERVPHGTAFSSEIAKAQEDVGRFIRNAFRLKRDKVAGLLPTFFMHAACHAAIRMDSTRKFNGNFLRDLHHGTAGVIYHDTMLTERPLAALLKSGKIKADTRFECVVISEEVEALEHLRALTGNSSSA
jgi:hypothetical protein